MNLEGKLKSRTKKRNKYNFKKKKERRETGKMLKMLSRKKDVKQRIFKNRNNRKYKIISLLISRLQWFNMNKKEKIEIFFKMIWFLINNKLTHLMPHSNNSFIKKRNNSNQDNNNLHLILSILKEILMFNNNPRKYNNNHKRKKKITHAREYLHKFMVQMMQKDKEYKSKNTQKN